MHYMWGPTHREEDSQALCRALSIPVVYLVDAVANLHASKTKSVCPYVAEVSA